MSGGLLTLTPETLKYQVSLKTPSCLAIEIKNGEKKQTIINTYINPKDTLAQNFISSIDELNMDNSQDIIIAGDFNSIDIQDYESNKVEMVKPNDIRVLRDAKIQSKLSELVLQDIGKLSRPIDVTHYDKRTRKHSRIDYIFTNLENADLNLLL